MADVIKRLKYYNGQFLQAPDFTAEQDYHLDRQRRHNRLLHTPGIVEGLAVTATANTTSASVAPGTALDGQGRQIVLPEPRTVGFPSSLNGQPALVVISYTQEESDDATSGDAGKTRWKEVPRVEAILDDGTPTGDRIPLARLQIAANGTIASHDTSVRIPAGARVRPDETFERLRLSRQGSSPSQWPVLTSGAPNRADLAGDLNVTGNILVTGTVDGRDVSADGVKLDNLALSQIKGVSNPGGNIDLIGANGISITGNDSNNTITVTGGAPTSIANVSNPGGNIAITGSGGISITANDASNTINISTSPSAIGALATNDYLKRVVTYTSFATDETAKVVPCGFLPKQISVHFTIWGSFSSYYHTIYPTGVITVSGTNNWTSYGSYHYVRRYTNAPYWESWGYTGYTGLAYVDFYDYVGGRYGRVQLSLDSVNSSEFVIRADRYTYTDPPVYIYIYCQISILG